MALRIGGVPLLGHAHAVTKRRCRRSPHAKGLLRHSPRCPAHTEAMQNQSRRALGGAMLALSLNVLKYRHGSVIPYSSPSASVIRLTTRTTRAASVLALAPRELSVDTSASAWPSACDRPDAPRSPPPRPPDPIPSPPCPAPYCRSRAPRGTTRTGSITTTSIRRSRICETSAAITGRTIVGVVPPSISATTSR